ncbi:MAG: CHAT domain-containing protein [Caldilineaceae bacterium]
MASTIKTPLRHPQMTNLPKIVFNANAAELPPERLLENCIFIPASTNEQIKQLLALSDAAEQMRFAIHCARHNPEFVAALKDEATLILRNDIQTSSKLSELLLRLAQVTRDPLHRALGLLAQANCRSLGGKGEYQAAIEQYEDAATIYRQAGLPVEEGRANIGRVLALGQLGRYQEALAVGSYAQQIFESHQQWFQLARLTVNLGLIQMRLHDDRAALACFDRAIEAYNNLESNVDVLAAMARVQHNRVIALRNLGEFDQAITSGKRAYVLLTDTDQTAEAARCQQTMAVTNFVLGRYNEALELLFSARDYFVAEDRQSDALLVELYISDCLLQLRRFQDVLEKTAEMRQRFIDWGANFEAGQTILNHSIALSGLQRHAEAIAALHDARRLFEQEGNMPWLASVEVEMAVALQRQAHFDESLEVAQRAVQVFADYHLPVEEARAQLVAARACFALDRTVAAQQQAERVLELSQRKDIPALAFQAYQLLGQLAEFNQDDDRAYVEYQQAIEQLERLRGRVMIEFRMDFVDDKQGIYEDMVSLCLRNGRLNEALHYVERAKSRSLVELLAQRSNLNIQVDHADDAPLAAQLAALRSKREQMLQREREQLYRRWEQALEWRYSGEPLEPDASLVNSQGLSEVEKQITEIWHKLLIRNADYARNAPIWSLPVESIQPYLEANMRVVEYFSMHGQIIALLITPEQIYVHHLPVTLEQVQTLIQLVNLNMHATSSAAARQVPALLANVQGQLHSLYQALIAPFAEHLLPESRLIIVPHGVLHYLPFHALFDGLGYLLETYEISYLPCGSLLHFCGLKQTRPTGALAIGYSYGNRLPYAQNEAERVADILQGRAMVEEQATLALLQEQTLDVAVLHLATHGQFRADNSLFSGLALADGWLTTLDIFDLHLKTSLVTVSACQTGRNVIGGGDELLGLSRAFLYAGSASLLLSLWSVEDRSTAQLMELFYQKLAAGWGKAAALRYAQRSFIEQTKSGLSQEDAVIKQCFAHPYFWAPFFLIGDAGSL